ncbi:M16 peptidase-like protein [Aureococcus anophagefferens]|nr:M16 peptidase-like protein [Aureococcus anophagefferens]
MGSRKRERLFGTGSQTNAYTDFHHTVFYACCPREAPGGGDGGLGGLLGNRGGASMLPRALDALCEVLQAQFAPARVEKERAAVLSEMSMVNTIEYRVECQILRTLHAENSLARRFPIGLEDQIKAWTTEDVMAYHREHYRPDNCLLYVVGDVRPPEVEAAIAKAFAGVPKPRDARPTPRSLKAQSRHFPPIVHTWSGGRLDGKADVVIRGEGEDRLLELDEAKYLLPLDVPPTPHPDTQEPVRAHVFQHELLQQFSFHLFAKRPVEAITTLEAHRLMTARRIVLSALQVRLNVMARTEPLFSFVEFQYLDSAREACAVCSLDMNGDAARWEDAVAAAVRETKRMGQYGLTQGELERFGASLVTDSEQLAAMGDQLAHGDQLTHLMETVSCAHTFMDPAAAHEATLIAVESLTLEEVNAEAQLLMPHVVDFGDAAAPSPSAMIACAPATLSDGTPVVIDTDRLLAVAAKAAAEELEPEPELEIPAELMGRGDVADLLPDPLVPVDLGDLDPYDAEAAKNLGVRVSKLANGARVIVKALPHEAQRGALRLTCAGGRAGEAKLGSAALGARGGCSLVLGDDARFLSLPNDAADALSLEDVRSCVMAQLDPANVEISVVGDVDAERTEALAREYVGSVPSKNPNPATDAPPGATATTLPPNPDAPLRVHVSDSDPRAVAYIAGAAPNRLGVLADGRSLVEALLGTADTSKAPERWRHPLFPAVALSLLQEVANRRLFSVVRERKQLTYDANFHFSDHERLNGGWYLVSVTASPANAERALEACRETLQGLDGPQPAARTTSRPRGVVINRHVAELNSNKYWCEQLTGCAMDAVPNKKLAGIRDYVASRGRHRQDARSS